MIDPDKSSRKTSSEIDWTLPAVAFLFCEGIGVLIWWTILILVPNSRAGFKASGAPDSTLLAFAGADLVFFIGASLGAAFGLWRRRDWAWPILCLHTGAGVYAALYCLGLFMLSGGAWLAAVLMAPSLFALPFFTWQLRPDYWK